MNVMCDCSAEDTTLILGVIIVLGILHEFYL